MIDHVSIGVRDVAAAKRFYDAALAPFDHDEFGSKRSKLINVIDPFKLARDSREKPVSTFSHPALGCACLSDSPGSLGYGKGSVALWISAADRPVPADERSGLHFCFAAPSRDSVQAFHAAALAKGGHDNGGPGLRTDYGPDYYAAFVVDPDGYRLEAYCATPAKG